jgi:GTP-binding protein
MPEARDKWPGVKKEIEKQGYPILQVSAISGTGARELLYRAAQCLAEAPPVTAAQEVIPVYRPEEDRDAFTLTRERAGWRLAGARIERAAKMTYWEYDEAVARFQRILGALGIREALEQAGVKGGDTVYIGEFELEWSE